MKKNVRFLSLTLTLFMILSFVLPVNIVLAASGPVIYLSEPASGVVDINSVPVSGYVTNTTSLKISVNGNQENVSVDSEGFFSYTANNLNRGTNTIRIIASGPSGSTSRDISVVYEPEIATPQVTVNNYADYAEVNQNTVDLDLTLQNTVSLTITVNGRTVPNTYTSGSHSVQSIMLDAGTNTIRFTAQSSTGVINTTIFHLKLNTDAPGIQNLSPYDGTSFSKNTITLTGNVVNVSPSGLTVSVNGGAAQIVGFDSLGRFNYNVTISPGTNTITLNATNGAATITKTINVNLNMVPSIAINSPTDNSSVVTRTVTIKGKVFNVETGGLTINGQQVSFTNGTGDFSKVISLERFSSDIIIKAVNGTQVTTKILKINFIGNPAINITSPENGAEVGSSDVVFEGNVFPADQDEIASLTITGSGTNYKDKINSDGSFQLPPVTLQSGENKVDFVLVTTNGRQITRTITVKCNDGPSIDVWYPVDGSSVYSNVITIRGGISKADLDTFKVGDQKPTVKADGSFSATYNLKAGKNDIKISTSYGKTTYSKTVTVYYSQLAKEGAELRTKVGSTTEIKAFEDLVKIKLPKGAVGLNTISEITVRDATDFDDPPVQSAFIGPVVRIDWDGGDPIKPYKITLKYDDVVPENQSHKVSIFYFDTEDDEWQILGGLVDAKSHTVSIETGKVGYFAAAIYFLTYNDMNKHWARRDVEFITARGAVLDNPRNFRPDSSISRAEFVTYLVKALGLPTYKPDQESYTDVSDGNKAYEYIETALRAGIVSGVTRSDFEPDRTITREEAASILARAANLKSVKDQEVVKILGAFDDAGQVSPWARKDVAAAVKAKLLSGANSNFIPRGTTTKAQAAAMIARLAESASKSQSK